MSAVRSKIALCAVVPIVALAAQLGVVAAADVLAPGPRIGSGADQVPGPVGFGPPDMSKPSDFVQADAGRAALADASSMPKGATSSAARPHTPWKVERTTDPRSRNGFLGTVSCPKISWCMAGGSYAYIGAGYSPHSAALALTWDDRGWTRRPVVEPAEPAPSWLGSSDSIAAVSCAGPSACLAITGHLDSEFQWWDGHGWTRVTAPSTGLADVTFHSVSCGSPTTCTALGSGYDGDFVPVIATRSAKQWKVEAAPLPESSDLFLGSLSCTSAVVCAIAGSRWIGDDEGNGVHRAFLLTRSVSGWSFHELPSAPDNGFGPVECVTPTWCIVVGTNSFGEPPFALRWNGTTASALPAPDLGTASFVDDIACGAVGSCFVVAKASVPDQEQPQLIAASLRGTSWRPETIPGDQVAINDVSCPSATKCTLVGHLTSDGVFGGHPVATLTLRWNDGAWARQSSPSPTGQDTATLQAVACPSGDACLAAGYNIRSSGHYGSLVQRRQAGRWSFATAPGPGGATDTFLNDVTCPALGSCVAVGGYLSPGAISYTGYAIVGHGSRWRVTSIPIPAGAVATTIESVSCSSASRCLAVGASWDGDPDGDLHGGYALFAATWDGHTWTVRPVPAPVVPPSGEVVPGFSGVSCPRANWCTAVGDTDFDEITSGGDIQRPIAMTWNGASWEQFPVPTPYGPDEDTSFADVACTSPSACTGVGLAFDVAGGGSFAARWDGQEWTTGPLPGVPGVDYLGGLLDVACSRATSCTAVGARFVIPQTIGEPYSYDAQLLRWDGAAWRSEATPEPAGVLAFFNGVTCTSTCTAVGGVGQPVGDELERTPVSSFVARRR